MPGQAPTSSDSGAMIRTLGAAVHAEELAGDGPWINTTSFSVPVYTVPAGQPRVAVALVDHAPDAALSSAWSAVPLPEDALPARGSDGDLVVWQPSTERLWEFWKLARTSAGWQARWGGAMRDVSSQRGVYEASAWPGAKPWWGVSATSLSLVGGLISLEDMQRGQIDHALSLAVPEARAATFASPAQRDDGASPSAVSLPEGAHLRLNPALDLAALHLPRVTLMLAQAAQRYGIFVIDHASDVTFYAEDPSPTGTNPYRGAGGYFEGKTPSSLLAAFPWSQLEVLQLELHHGS